MNKNKIRICHVSSAHPHNDTRVFFRECKSIAQAGYNVSLIIEGESEVCDGVNIIGLGEQPRSRLKRMVLFARKAYYCARRLDADIYHFHDPEMMPYALKLKKKGKIIIMDCHEDIASAILDKTWIPGALRKIISRIYGKYEKNVLKEFDGVIVVTKHIFNLFKDIAKQIVIVNNYPDLNDIEYHDRPFEQRDKIIGYAGNMSVLYGKEVLYSAMKSVDAKLILAGKQKQEQTENIKYIGCLNRRGVNELYGRSRLGVVLYQPAANNNESQPAKLFEYMAAGLPVVVSDFPLWREIVEKNECGLCVNPKDVGEISEKISYLIENPRIAQKMGENGYNAVSTMMNWKNESQKIFKMYECLSENRYRKTNY